LGSDREHRLQILQADLYSSIEKKFASKEGLVFFNRFDEMIAVSNGITMDEHSEFRDAIQDEFPVTMSMGIGVADTPFVAQLRASKLLQATGSAQSPTRSSVIACERTLDLDRSYVQIAHFDIDGVTQTHTDRLSAYETSMEIMALYNQMMQSFKSRETLLFYLGGDNFMGVADGISIDEIRSLIDQYRSRGINLKCGIGIARTGRKAAELATRNVDQIRNMNGTESILCSNSL
jgi:GTP cyclohydrolase IIa